MQEEAPSQVGSLIKNPNLQQIPARNKDLGPMIRSLFIPEEGHRWGVFDYLSKSLGW